MRLIYEMLQRKDICTGFRLMTHHEDFFLKSALFSNTTYTPDDSSFIGKVSHYKIRIIFSNL